MNYKHGSYTHDVHLESVEIVPEFNSLGQILRSSHRFTISGKVEGANQGALKTAIEQLEAAYEATVTESGLMHSDGLTESAHYLDIAALNTEKGINAQVYWLDGGAEYVYKRSFRIVVECSILGAGATEYEYSNRIIRIGQGGGPRRMRNTFSGPLIQQTYPSSGYFGIETGQKVSRIGAVVMPSPTYPSIVDYDQTQRETGTTRGADGITRYFAAWTFPMQSTGPF